MMTHSQGYTPSHKEFTWFIFGIAKRSPGPFPGRLGSSRARRLLLSVGGDVDIALAVLMDEDAES